MAAFIREIFRPHLYNFVTLQKPSFFYYTLPGYVFQLFVSHYPSVKLTSTPAIRKISSVGFFRSELKGVTEIFDISYSTRIIFRQLLSYH